MWSIFTFTYADLNSKGNSLLILKLISPKPDGYIKVRMGMHRNFTRPTGKREVFFSSCTPRSWRLQPLSSLNQPEGPLF
jgi:hypothetical protein